MSTNLHDHVVGRIEATQQLQMGQEATMFVDLNKVHLFEPGVTGIEPELAQEPAMLLHKHEPSSWAETAPIREKKPDG